jgi:ubiquinone biosynthesis protein UbiJ
MADAVLEILRVIQGDIAGLKADLGGVKTEVRVHSRTLDILLQEGRLLRAAVNDFAKENVTPGEVEAIHHDLNRLRHEVSELTVRVEMIEERGKPEH